MRRFVYAIPFLLAGSAAVANELDEAVEKYEYLQGERNGPVYVAKFYNPPTNLMNAGMVSELRDLLAKIEADEQTRVLVFTGGVENYFIQHYDVGELDQTATALKNNPELFPGPELHDTHKAYLEIEALSKPVIAAINGQAAGGGFELALACDFRILSKPGVVGLPEANVGILPGAGGTVRLPRLIGQAKAKELMMQGLVVDAETAERLGMVNKAVPVDDLMAESNATGEPAGGVAAACAGAHQEDCERNLEHAAERCVTRRRGKLLDADEIGGRAAIDAAVRGRESWA